MPDDQAPASPFLGALPDEDAIRPTVPYRFAVVADQVEQLVERWNAGELEADAAAAHLRSKQVIDHLGRTWTVGATTNAWYRKDDDGNWIADVPPREDPDEGTESGTSPLDDVPFDGKPEGWERLFS